MANPNIVQVSNILGKTGVLSVSTDATAIVENQASSNTIVKVNTLYISNIDTENRDVTVDLFRSSTAYHIGQNITIPDNATLSLLERPLYMEEGDSLRITGSANSALQAVCSYEVIS